MRKKYDHHDQQGATRAGQGRPAVPRESANALWVVDFAYVHTRAGLVCDASVIDAYARRIVGWKAGTFGHGGLRARFLGTGDSRRRRMPEDGLIHHRERGVQYLARNYTQRPVELLPWRKVVGPLNRPLTTPLSPFAIRSVLAYATVRSTRRRTQRRELHAVPPTALAQIRLNWSNLLRRSPLGR